MAAKNDEIMFEPDHFDARLQKLPRLGVGISTEFDAGRHGLDVNELARRHGHLVEFLEIGCDLERGVDADARKWVAEGRPTTYHFLDVNLEEGDDIESAWLVETKRLVESVDAAWICGDAGLWHIGPRDRGHGTLMPPILVPESAAEMARGIRKIREGTGREVLPENPPAHVYLGDMHLLDYFARVLDDADTGMLLDVSHLAVYQKVTGRRMLDGLDGFPCERIVEVHIAGGSPFEDGGLTFYDDDHGVDILEEAWEIYDEVLARSPNIKAVAFECERNGVDDVLPIFRRLSQGFSAGEKAR